MKDRTLFLFLVSLALLLGPARGGTQLLLSESVDPSSQNGQFPGVRLIDGSGIIDYRGQSAVALNSVHSESLTFGWASSVEDSAPQLEYFWKTPQDICGLVIWQGLGNVGVKDFVVTAFDAGDAVLGTWTFMLEEEVDVAGVAQDIPARLFPLASDEAPLTGVSRVLVELRSNHGGEFYSLGETHFAKPSDEPREGEMCVIDRRSRSKWMVPLDQKEQSIWYQPAHDDGRWRDGGACLGYEVGPLCEGLIVYLTMDLARVSATQVFDTSGSPNVHDGTRVGSLSLVPGQVLEGMRFPGNTQNFVQIPHHPELNPDKEGYSVALWVFPESSQALFGALAYKSAPRNESGWSIGVIGEDTLVGVETAAGVARSVEMPGLPANTWSHVAFVVDRANQRIIGYLNGVAQGATALAEDDVYGNDGPISLLNTPVVSDFGYRAVEDEFAIWKRALGEEEMSEVYKAGLEGRSFKTSGGSNGLYSGLIDTNVGTEMYGINSTVWQRIRFGINSTEGIVGMDLKMHYDDGFVCYLNGVEVARRNVPATAPTPLNFDQAAAGPRADNLALTPEVINLDGFVNLLNEGVNVLAIHGLNESKDAERFLICPELCIEKKDCRGRAEGTDFWVTFPENAEGDASNPKETSVCITGIAGTSGRVEMPRLGVSIPFVLNAQGEAKVFLSPILAELRGSDVVMDNGVHITAERIVSVVGLNHINYSTDGYLALPTAMLGNEHRVLGYPNVWDGLPQLNGSLFGVVATADGTIIQVTPTVDTSGHPAGVPYYVKLEEGQTYQLMNTEDGSGDLSGTLIRSNQPIGVFAGHRCANIASTGTFFCDYVVEQIPPIIHWRSASVVAPLATRLNGDTVRVLAALNGTEVRFNGAAQATINAGEVFQAVVTSPTVVTTNGPPVLVAQYSNSSDFDGVEDADPFMALAPTIDAFGRVYRVCAPPTGGFDKNFLNIVVPAAAVGATTVDGVTLVAVPGASFTPIPSTGLLHAVIPVSATSPHTLIGSQPFSVLSYGFASYDFDSYGYPAGFVLPRKSPRVTAPMAQTVYATAATGTASTPNIAGVSRADDDCEPPGTVTTTQSSLPARLEPGVYVVTLSATNSADLTGTATTLLRVLPPWPQVYFPEAYPQAALEATVWGCLADGDGDGWNNETEWQFGTLANDPSSFPRVEILASPDGAGSGLIARYRRRFNDPSASYVEQGSPDLLNWSSGAAVTQTLATELVFPGGDYEDVTIEALPTRQVPGPADYFLRVVGDGCPE